MDFSGIYRYACLSCPLDPWPRHLNCTTTPSQAPPPPPLLELLHPVKSRAGLEPLDLGLVEGVVQGDGVLAAVAMLDHRRQGLGEGEGEKQIICILIRISIMVNGQKGITPAPSRCSLHQLWGRSV